MIMNKFLTLTLLLIITLLTVSAYSSPLVGQRIKVTGQWNGEALMVHQVKYRDARKDPQRGRVSGLIDTVDLQKRQLLIGPMSIVWNSSTYFEQLNQTMLAAGISVKVTVQRQASGQLIASRIKSAGSRWLPGAMSLIGHITHVKADGNGNQQVKILGITGIIQDRLTNPALQLTRRQDDRRPEDQLSVEVFDRPLVIGGEVGLSPRYREDFRLDPKKNDDRLRLDAEVQLELFYAWAPNIAFFAEGKADGQVRLYREGNKNSKTEGRLRRGETWAFWGDIGGSGVSLQAGRQNYQDIREWWWDEDLDSLRVYFTQPFLHFELGVGQRLAVLSTEEDQINPWQKDVLRILSHTRWEWASGQALSLFFLHRHDYSDTGTIGALVKESALDATDSDLTWVGVRSMGKLDVGDRGGVKYWLDMAWVGGDETLFDFEDTNDGLQRIDSIERQHIDGWAVDAGLTWEIELPWRPSFTLGYAIGSKQFRQTGLQDNNNKFNGVDRFRYYGELLRPELANLQIWTLSAGIPLLNNSSVELVYHHYQQVVHQDFLRDVRIRAKLTGNSGAIGQEWDLVLGLEEWRNLEMEFVTGVFRAGSAYGRLSGRTALNILLKLNYNF